MNTCKNCANSVYDDRCGFYRCKIYQHKIKNVDKYLDCENHELKPWMKKDKREKN